MVGRGSKRPDGGAGGRVGARPSHAPRRSTKPRRGEADHTLAKAQEIATLGSWEIDFGAGRFVASAEARRIFGWAERARPSVALVLDAVHPDDRAAVEVWLSPPVQGRPRAEECFFRALRRDREGVLLYGRCGAALSARGRRELLIGTVQDMTRLVAVERDAHRQASFYRGIFENSVSGIFQTTADGQYITANAALARIYGYENPSDLLSALTNIGGQLYVDPVRRVAFVEEMRRKGIVSSFESQVYRRDGSVIWISESCREVRTRDGTFLYYEGVVEEITDRKRTEEELRAAMAATEAANNAKSEFLNTMSHELRTPLNAIIGFSEVIHGELLGPVGVPAYKTYAADVINSGRHLLTVINDILDFAKAESGQLSLREETLSLASLVEETVRFLQHRAVTAGLRLSVDLTAAPVALRGDGPRLRQVLLNLVGNAIKFTPHGGRVDIRAFTGLEGEGRIEIRDSGIGMRESELARAFEPFHQADGSHSRNHDGTGLGLAICDRLVRLHGGTLRLVSEFGRGTVATVIFPAERCSNAAALDQSDEKRRSA
jgi:PAS domain S-box-containing protein